MRGDLRFDFVVDQTNNRMTVTREFAARRQLVWDCFTSSDLLDRWFAPKPFTARTEVMDFREGGYWHYVMIDPEGKEYWGRTDYTDIHPIDSYAALDGFCDAFGVLTPTLPQSKWDVTFTDVADGSQVQIIVTYDSADDLETVMRMGMKEGLTATLDYLDELLQSLEENRR